MRVTIGERLGLVPSKQVARPRTDATDDLAPHEEVPDRRPRLDLRRCASSDYVPPHPERREDDGGPARVTGHMEFIHKTAPTLVIHGRDTISPEEYAAGRRR